jgi:hypothetical protein
MCKYENVQMRNTISSKTDFANEHIPFSIRFR